MTTMFVPQDVVDSQLSQCTDGEVGDFTIKGGTFTTVPGGAVITGETVTKAGYAKPPTDMAAAVKVEPPGIGPEVKAVVGRKPSY